MKRTIISLAIIFAAAGGIYGEELTGGDIIQKVNELMSQETSYGKSKMTVTTSSGDERTFLMESWSSDEGEKNLVRYLEPRRVRGQAVLMLNDANDIWMYFPRTRRVRKLATHAKKRKMQGSDFSYEDMGSGDAFITDFKAERLEDEEINDQDCYKLELTKKEESDMSYSRLVMWVTKKNFYPVVIDYYDEDYPDRRLKRLVQSDIRKVDGVPTSFLAVMTNENDNTKTIMQIVEIKYDVKIDEDFFTERGLKR